MISWVVFVGVVKHLLARELRLQLGRDEKSSGELSVQGIGFFRRRSKPVLEESRNELHDPVRSALLAEIEHGVGAERLPKDHDRVDVSFLHYL